MTAPNQSQPGTALLPCPFCGGAAEHRRDGIWCEGPECGHFALEVARWNTRAAPRPSDVAGREEIAKIIDPQAYEEIKGGWESLARLESQAHAQLRAEAKADRILALSAPVPDEARKAILRDEADRVHDRLYGFAQPPAAQGEATSPARSEVLEDLAHVRSALKTLCSPADIKVEECLTGVGRTLAVIERMRSIAATALLHVTAALTQPQGADTREAVKPIVSTKPMSLSDGRTDYFVSIKVADREVTPHVFREEYKAAYHVALYDWLLNGAGEEPCPVDFGPKDWPAQSSTDSREVGR